MGSVAYTHLIGKDYKWYNISGIFLAKLGDYISPIPPIRGTRTTIDEVPLNVDECFTQKNDQTQMAKTLATEWQEVKGESYKSTANQCFGRDQRKKI